MLLERRTSVGSTSPVRSLRKIEVIQIIIILIWIINVIRKTHLGRVDLAGEKSEEDRLYKDNDTTTTNNKSYSKGAPRSGRFRRRDAGGR